MRGQPAPISRWPSCGPIPPCAVTNAEATCPTTLPWSAAHNHEWCHGTGALLQDLRVPTAAACSAPRTAPSPTAPGKDSERGNREGPQGEGHLRVTGLRRHLSSSQGHAEWETQLARWWKVFSEFKFVPFFPFSRVRGCWASHLSTK